MNLLLAFPLLDMIFDEWGAPCYVVANTTSKQSDTIVQTFLSQKDKHTCFGTHGEGYKRKKKLVKTSETSEIYTLVYEDSLQVRFNVESWLTFLLSRNILCGKRLFISV